MVMDATKGKHFYYTKTERFDKSFFRFRQRCYRETYIKQRPDKQNGIAARTVKYYYVSNEKKKNS